MNLYKRILKYIQPYSFFVILSILASLFFVFFNTFSLWIVSSLISSIMMPENSTLALVADQSKGIYSYYNQISDLLIPNASPITQLKSLCIVLVSCFIFKNIFYYINNVSLAYVQNKMIKDFRNKYFQQIQSLPLSFFDKSKTGELSSIFMGDISSMRTTFTQTIQNMINEPINIIVMSIMLFSISSKLTLISFISIPFSAFVIIKLGQSIKRKVLRTSIQNAGILNIFQETVSSIRIVKAFSMQSQEMKKFAKENLKFFKLYFKLDMVRFLIAPANDIIGICIGVLLLWIGGTEVLIYKALDPNDFMKFIIFLFAMLQPIRKLSGVNTNVQSGLASASRVFGILDKKSDIIEIKGAKKIESFNKSISFKEVSFSYIEDTKVLKNINTSLEKGKTYAIVGPSGSGKSTFIDLIPRFYDVSEGSIFIDSIDIKDLKINSLRDLIGIVTQDVMLFNDTILNNVKYGSKNKSEKDVIEACKNANAIDFINELPEQFNTIVGERGVKLSGGQKQRISIARAILKNPEILIFDEATSSLDSESEEKVQRAIDSLVKDRTVLIIAHRLSTIKNADEIIVMEKGEIIERGKHKELINLNGRYAALYELQS
ncbi:MAG: hypothetical protein CBD58_01475 [bacterium TMED198]|nr:MAG: hypothetical protein CBD58_01475 [bacterium TMED198]